MPGSVTMLTNSVLSSIADSIMQKFQVENLNTGEKFTDLNYDDSYELYNKLNDEGERVAVRPWPVPEYKAP